MNHPPQAGQPLTSLESPCPAPFLRGRAPIGRWAEGGGRVCAEARTEGGAAPAQKGLDCSPVPSGEPQLELQPQLEPAGPGDSSQARGIQVHPGTQEAQENGAEERWRGRGGRRDREQIW